MAAAPAAAATGQATPADEIVAVYEAGLALAESGSVQAALRAVQGASASGQYGLPPDETRADDLSKVVAPLERGDAGAAEAALDEVVTAGADPALHERLVRLHQGPVCARLGKQGQATVLYLEAVTAPVAEGRFELLRGLAQAARGTFVKPFVSYDLGQLYLTRRELAQAVDSLQEAAGLARWQLQEPPQ